MLFGKLPSCKRIASPNQVGDACIANKGVSLAPTSVVVVVLHRIARYKHTGCTIQTEDNIF